MRICLIILAFGFFDHACLGQPRPADAAGIQRPAMLAINSNISAKHWAEAWRFFPILDDTGRIIFYASMIDKRFAAEGSTPAGMDSVNRYIDLLLPLCTTNGNSNCLLTAYVTAATCCFKSGDRTRAAKIWDQGFQGVRRCNDIFNEFEYMYAMVDRSVKDSARTPAMLAWIDSLAADGDRLLPATSSDSQRHCIQAITLMAGIFNSGRQRNAAMQVALQARRINQQIHQHDALPNFMLSLIYSEQGMTNEAFAISLEGLRVAETPQGPADGMGYQAIIKICYATKDDHQCLKYFYEALPYFRRTPLIFSSPVDFIRNAILSHLRLRQPAEALNLMRQMADISARTTHFMDGDPASFNLLTADCYAALDQADSAEFFFRKSLAWLPQPGFTFAKCGTYLDMATFYVRNRQFARAKPLLDTVTMEGNRTLTTISNMERAYLLRYQVDSALHHYPQSMTDLRRYLLFHDSLLDIAKNRQLTEINVQYETEKKNQHIGDLEKQNALQTRLQQSILRQSNIVRNSLIGGAALLAIFAAILYNRWRIRRRMALRLEKLSRRQEKLLGEKEKLLGEKEWLLREINHRVKNNLQIIISLLRTQADQLKDEIAISAFEVISARINTISLVHRKLYFQSQNRTSINMRDYIHELVEFLQEGLGAGQSIAFHLEMGDLALDAAQCVPLGLILNEAITNAIKYAFPATGTSDLAPGNSMPAGADRRPLGPGAMKTILISLKEGPSNLITLCIADNGVGLPPGINSENTGSLGLLLIRKLTLQLDGTLEIFSNPGPVTPSGLTICVRFPMSDIGEDLK